MAQHEAWQVGGSAAELYQRYLVPAIASLWAADLIDRAAPRPGERVLDVACGTGVVARLAAERMGSGRVVGLDINAGMLAAARSLSPGAGPSIEWYEGSALTMPFPDASFDLCLCQLGLQFFPDRPAAMREMFRVLQLGGRVALSVFSAIEHTPVTNALADASGRARHRSSVRSTPWPMPTSYANSRLDNASAMSVSTGSRKPSGSPRRGNTCACR
jgi:ubiquinone/menaquinone biosynthesis C-methylase UbiE